MEDSNRCVHCNEQFSLNPSGKSYTRYPLCGKLRREDTMTSKALEDTLHLDYPITPIPTRGQNRFLCQNCYGDICTAYIKNKSCKEAVDKLKRSIYPGGYIGSKRVRPPSSTPMKTKRSKV